MTQDEKHGYLEALYEAIVKEGKRRYPDAGFCREFGSGAIAIEGKEMWASPAWWQYSSGDDFPANDNVAISVQGVDDDGYSSDPVEIAFTMYFDLAMDLANYFQIMRPALEFAPEQVPFFLLKAKSRMSYKRL